MVLVGCDKRLNLSLHSLPVLAAGTDDNGGPGSDSSPNPGAAAPDTPTPGLGGPLGHEVGGVVDGLDGEAEAGVGVGQVVQAHGGEGGDDVGSGVEDGVGIGLGFGVDGDGESQSNKLPKSNCEFLFQYVLN